MSNTYSVDLRERPVAFVLKGGSRGTPCEIFQIGENTLYRWLRQHRSVCRPSDERAPQKRITCKQYHLELFEFPFCEQGSKVL
ncbi:MAG: hypothetical protein GKS05_01200 [Nitrospirales bacterium]|nr:hypothetical protein [Nitrospirales bacterium]